jgi:hypothetical protein
MSTYRLVVVKPNGKRVRGGPMVLAVARDTFEAMAVLPGHTLRLEEQMAVYTASGVILRWVWIERASKSSPPSPDTV